MYTYDDQLMDAVKVRRRRLAGALLHREDRLRRTWSDGIGTLLVSVFLAILVCAVCVGVSFVTHLLSKDPVMKNRPAYSVTEPTSSPTRIPMAPAPSSKEGE